jgi:hypothetical protein
MTKRAVVVFVIVAVAACAKHDKNTDTDTDKTKDKAGVGGGGDGKPQTLAIGDSGFVVDVPAGWTLNEDRKGMYTVKLPTHHGLHIEEETFPASKPEELAEPCQERGRTIATSEALPSGGAVVTCKGESTVAKGVMMTMVHVSIVKDAKSSFSCFIDTEDDPAAVLGVCKSIRKK